MSDYFITGTDTGVGKTWATLALMKAMQNKGKIVVGMKPVACGCEATSEGLRNDDAVKILEQSSQSLNYKTVNPYAFERSVAPHIAADLEEIEIDIEKIAREFNKLKKNANNVVVEGIGGWNVPLGTDIMLAELVVRLNLPVILVIGLRLGCINLALSAAKIIEADGAKFHGWMTNQLDPYYECPDETMSTLRTRINAPFLGRLPYMEKFDLEILASHIMITESSG